MSSLVGMQFFITLFEKLGGYAVFKGLQSLAKHFGWTRVILVAVLIVATLIALWLHWKNLPTAQIPAWLATAITLTVSVFLILRTSIKVLPQKRLGLIGVAGGDQYDTGRLWKRARQYLANSQHIRYLGSTGEKSFATDGAPLKEIFDEANTGIKIQILLIHPASEFVQMRVNDLTNIGKKQSGDINDYQTEIKKAIAYCKSLRKAGKDIELRLYNRALVWKLILSSHCLWQQSYPPGRPSSESPANLFVEDGHKSKKSAGMFEPFSRLFDMLFESSLTINLLDSNESWWETINCKDHLESMASINFIGPRRPTPPRETSATNKRTITTTSKGKKTTRSSPPALKTRK